MCTIPHICKKCVKLDIYVKLVAVVAFRDSKYVQSSVDGVYKWAKQDLTDDRRVLFSGTPCQVAALRQFLEEL